MPTKIQTPDPGSALKKVFGFKGRFPMILDEVVVPVYVLGQGDPDLIPLNNNAPAGSEPLIRFVTTTGSGAGNRKCILVQLNDQEANGDPVEDRNVLIERIVVRGSNTVMLMGIGLDNVVPQGVGTVNQLFLRNNAGSPNVSPSPLFGTRVIARGFNQSNGGGFPQPGPIYQRIDTQNQREFELNWVLGTQFSVGDTDGLPWERTADANLIRGNREFWIQGDALNDDLTLTIYASVLPKSAEL